MNSLQVVTESTPHIITIFTSFKEYMETNNTNYSFRKAEMTDAAKVWEIIAQAIERRRRDGSTQWQDGYPNTTSIQNDITDGCGYVIEIGSEIAAYCALIFDIEPAYEKIEGKWHSDGPYAVIHRVAVSDAFAGQGLAKAVFKEAEKTVLQSGIKTIKVDTNFDNAAMLSILKSLGYQYRGEVYFRGSARQAFEKTLME